MVARIMSVGKRRPYYGWAIVAVGFVVEFVFISLRVYGTALFFKPITQDFGWSRAMYSGIQSLTFAVDGLLSPFVGPRIDKRGGRGLMIFGLALGGAGLLALGFVKGLWDFYLIRGVVITFAFVCSGPLVMNVAISNWFIRKRGKAIALSLMGVSVGGVVLSPLMTYLIGAYGWRSASMIWGIAVWMLTIPPVAFFVKRRPEDIGLLPDGGQRTGDSGRGTGPHSPTPDPRPPTPEQAWTRGEAMRTSTLWLMVLAFGFSGVGGTGLGLHILPYLTDIGLSEAAAATAYSVHAAALTFAKILGGILVDKYPVRYCGAGWLVLMAASTALFALLVLWPSVWLVYLTVILIGCGFGGQSPTSEVLWATYYGRLSLGAVRTVASPFSVLFSAVGPLFGGWAYDRFGSYQVAFTCFSLAFAIGAGLIYFARPPKKAPKEGHAPASAIAAQLEENAKAEDRFRGERMS